MSKVVTILTGLPYVIIGAIISFYSKRLSVALIKSTKLMEETFNIKRQWGKGAEIFAQIILIIFGFVFMLAGIRVILEAFVNK